MSHSIAVCTGRLFVFFVVGLTSVQARAEDDFQRALELLQQSSFVAKGQAVAALIGLGDAHALGVLRPMLDGNLYVWRGRAQLVVATAIEDGFALTDPLSGEALGTAGKSALAKVAINNQLRLALRTAIARLSLGSKNAETRRSAVEAMAADVDADTAALIAAALDTETDDDVRAAMRLVLALSDISSADAEKRRAAAVVLGESASAEARNKLQALLANETETDPAVREAAETSLERIERRQWLYGLVETGYFGISLGLVLVLAAIGLAITFGVMGVINMAHGEMMMLGAYTAYVVQLVMPDAIDWSLIVAVPLAFVVAGAAGVAIERGVVRFLYGRPLETLLATFGISLVLQQLVRTIFSPLNRPVATPSWMSGQLVINDALSLTYNRLYIIVFSIAVFAALLVVLKRTKLGLQIRAVSQNRNMAKAMGIRTEWIDAVTFGLGSGIAGVAGVALSQLTNVGPNLGQSYIIDSFMVVVFGGVGNLWGTLVGGLTLGVANKVLEPYAGAVLAKIAMLVFIVVFIQRRPRGLFPQRGRAVET